MYVQDNILSEPKNIDVHSGGIYSSREHGAQQLQAHVSFSFSTIFSLSGQARQPSDYIQYRRLAHRGQRHLWRAFGESEGQGHL